MKRTICAAALLLFLLVSATAASAHVTRIPGRCKDATAPRLCAIHFHHDRASRLHVRMGMSRIPYRWVAEGHPGRRDRILSYWVRVHNHSIHQYKKWRESPVSGVPASIISALNCISTKEEYGVTGQNTVAGYFGMVSSPSSYPEPGGHYASVYGNSWLSIPLSAQYEIAYAEYQTYGWSPWTTAGACGL